MGRKSKRKCISQKKKNARSSADYSNHNDHNYCKPLPASMNWSSNLVTSCDDTHTNEAFSVDLQQIQGGLKRIFVEDGLRDLSSVFSDHREPEEDYFEDFNTSADDHGDWACWEEALQNFYLTHTEADDKHHTEKIDSDGGSADEFYVIMDKPYMYHHKENVDEFVQRIVFEKRFSMLRHDLRIKMMKHPDLVLLDNRDSLKLVEFYGSSIASVKWSLEIDRFCKPSLHVHRQTIHPHSDFWLGLPHTVTSMKDIDKILEKLNSHSVCVGNWEEHFTDLIPNGATITHTGSLVSSGYREGDFGAVNGETLYSTTIRSIKCHFLVRNGQRCQACITYRATLRSMHQRKLKTPSPESCPQNLMSSRVPNGKLTRTQLVQKMQQHKNHAEELQRDLSRLKRAVAKTIQCQGHRYTQIENEDFLQMVKDYTGKVHESYPDANCVQRLFWDQQMKANRLKDKRGMRWHPMIVKWCLYLRHKSPKTYECLKNTGFLTLPTSRTLFDYTSVLPKQLGFQTEIIDHCKQEAQKFNMNCNDHRSYVGILQDEVKIKEGLVYDSGTDELIGYMDLDKVGNELCELERIVKEQTRELASSVLVFMVRGITTNFKYPLAAFATRGVTADLLYVNVWKAIQILELNCALKVLFVTCDGASPNRKFFNLHKVENTPQPTHYTWNLYGVPKRKLYFISDVPHLLKTTRNCFSNSHSHKMSRKLWKDGKDISWASIMKLFEDSETNVFRYCPKLTRAHVSLTPFAQMRVNLAAQVLSKTVADALDHLYGDEVSETVSFIRHMDKFFDCLNVRNLYEGKRKRNEHLNAFKSVDDPRLEYLVKDFLGYFEHWKQSVQNREGDFSKTQQGTMMLSKQTLDGLTISVNSIVECTKYMLNEGADFVLTHRFNQDPLEEQFAHYRHKGGACDNPTVYQVRNTIRTLRTVKSTAVSSAIGNISKKRSALTEIDNTPLPKRKNVA